MGPPGATGTTKRKDLHLPDIGLNGPASPCIDVCRLDRGYHYCIGCLRTITEIKRWSAMTAQEKQSVIDALPARRHWRGIRHDPDQGPV